MRRIVSNPSLFAAIKGASVFSNALVIERLWKDHPRKAVILLTAINVAMVAVVARNYRIGSLPLPF